MGRRIFQLASLAFSFGTQFPSLAASSETPDAIVILSVLLDGKPDAELQSLLTDHLKLDGQPLQDGILGPEEKTCQQSDCMGLIIQRRPGAGRILRADIETIAATTDGQASSPTYKIVVSEFIQAGRKSWSQSAFCNPCVSRKALATTLNSVAIQTLSGPSIAVLPEQMSSQGPVRPPRSPWTKARIATVATLGGASAVALILGGVLLSLNGQATSAYQCTPRNATPLPADPSACLYTTVPIGATFIGAGAALGVTTITLALIWSSSGKSQKKSPSVKSPYSAIPSETPATIP